MRTVGARKTTVGELDQASAMAFVAENHRQGVAQPGKNVTSYGLWFQDELVAVAVFSNPRTSGMLRRYTAELFRMAFKEGVRVQGGASKLIRHYIRTKEPRALFTYQASDGELTDVYAHAGMTLVSKAKPKQILVRDGVELSAVENNRRDWFSMEQAARFGPDKLLNVSLGEVFREDRSRKSNIELFIEDCGYRLETVPGDAVYEWLNPDVSYYTYKITSIEKPGYYYGRRTIKSANPTVEDCLKDGYLGSGGTKFKNWKASVSPESIVKDILGIYSSWSEVVKAEAKLVGELYRTDSNCLNSTQGGITPGAPTHSKADLKKCEIHGTTLFRRGCLKCASATAYSEKECEVHGKTTFRGARCVKCQVARSHKELECAVHGVTLFRGGKCAKCSTERALAQKECSVHGLAPHYGKRCYLCHNQESVSLKQCPVHGETKHQGETCGRCTSEKQHYLAECSKHGNADHRNGACQRCLFEATIHLSVCSTHGEVKHQGEICLSCKNSSTVSTKDCPTHGLAKHQGDTCSKCSANLISNLRECPRHGLVKHKGSSCDTCASQKSLTLQECGVHGEVKFQGGKCVKCRNTALFTVKNCPLHGDVKHRGNSCATCTSEKRKANLAAKKAARSQP